MRPFPWMLHQCCSHKTNGLTSAYFTCVGFTLSSEQEAVESFRASAVRQETADSLHSTLMLSISALCEAWRPSVGGAEAVCRAESHGRGRRASQALAVSESSSVIGNQCAATNRIVLSSLILFVLPPRLPPAGWPRRVCRDLRHAEGC